MKKHIYNNYIYVIIIAYSSIIIIYILLKTNKVEITSLKIYFKKKLYSDIINYNGEKLLKSKLLDNYLSGIPDIYLDEKNQEKKLFNEYYYLDDYSNDPTIKKELRSKFLEFISKKKNQNVTKLDVFYLNKAYKFGNQIIALSNTIFYCEIVGCNSIIIKKKLNVLISKPVYIKKYNITISLGSNIDCKKTNILCFYEISLSSFFPRIIMPQVRIEFIKREILRNLPNVNIDPNDLYIHIRGGDIFKYGVGKNYAQPPLCYYEKVINNNASFKTIHIISMDHSNLVLDNLMKKYENIIYKKNNLKYDISVLCHAFNIAVSVSSFAFSAIKLNDNLKNLWEFDMIRLSQKLFFLHHHIFQFRINYKIYSMKPSEIYRKKMFSFKRTKEQLKLMIKDKCTYDFVRIK